MVSFEALVFVVFSLPFLAIGLGALGFGGLMCYGAGKRLLGTAHASVTDPVDPADAPPGSHAVVTGEARAGPEGALVAPLSGAEAVAHRLRLEQRTDGVGWWTVVDDGHSRPFSLQGPVDRLRVDPDGELPAVEPGDPLSIGPSETLPDRVRERFAGSERFDLEATPGLLASAVDEPRRYEEATVETGETVYVYGYVTDEDPPRLAAAESNDFRFGREAPTGFTDEDADTLGDVAGRIVVGAFLLVFGTVFASAGGTMFLGGVAELL